MESAAGDVADGEGEIAMGGAALVSSIRSLVVRVAFVHDGRPKSVPALNTMSA